MSDRRICVVTGTRAEYGLLYWLLREIESDAALELQLVVTGAHLSPEFGRTVDVIEADGFPIRDRVEMLVSSDSAVGTAKSVGLGVIGFADAFARLEPDIVVVLGDRFEILAAVQAALVARIPVAHIHGGESSEGAMDEAIRHAITKMAHLHFTAAGPYRQRVIQLGEAPDRVFEVGSPGLDFLHRTALLGREELGQALGFGLGEPLILVTYHPVSLADRSPEESVGALLGALDRFPDATVIFTRSNADAGGRAINRLLAAYAAAHPDRARLFDSLGQERYLSAMALADVVVGNSSSGIIEAPALGVPTVNVGPRQRGRLRAPSILDVEEDTEQIAEALERALSPGFRASLEGMTPPYGRGPAAETITRVLRETGLGEALLMKTFHDIPMADRRDVSDADGSA